MVQDQLMTRKPVKSLGICIGATSITWTQMAAGSSIKIINSGSKRHEGNPKQALYALLHEPIFTESDKVLITGRKLRHMIKATTVSEPEALEAAHRFAALDNAAIRACNTIVSAGGETFMIYRLADGKGIVGVNTGNKCASGTGEFFLQQLSRMDLDLDSALTLADGKNPYRVAGRCSVFCKSDCTHALNKGTEKSRVIAGLCEMMAGKISELLKTEQHSGILLVGGSAKNHVMVDFLTRSGLQVTVPKHAWAFESTGAALLALEQDVQPVDTEDLFSDNGHGFGLLPALSAHIGKVRFMPSRHGKVHPKDVCVVGLDVGSTTTKAVLLRTSDKMVLSSCYLRTNGDPIGASRRCYEALLSDVQQQAGTQDTDISVIGLGVTGSGRQLAALHALTPAIINEIIAHARAAAHFDPEVDTIFEIGGQDAKYTYLTNGVASDYAMNEACSAGTGSFLEEAARESLNLATEQIGDAALKGAAPPNFNDQCAAFIGSDIKTAIQSGLGSEDISAGIVYSVCMNYMNRVKGNRSMGRKIFMQGGVCYNKAVPVAMAVLTGRDIIVPPDPGLMGAFGVALETLDRQQDGRLPVQSFDLADLAERTAEMKDAFVCAGGAEGCDRKCSINRIVIDGQTYPFGGACDKYYNLLSKRQKSESGAPKDLVALREQLVFETYGGDATKAMPTTDKRVVGMNKSLMMHTLFPFFNGFFRALGHPVLLSSHIDQEGCDRKSAAFCRPIEQAHGAMTALLADNPDIIFLPHIKAMPVPGGAEVSVTCPFVQAEPYTLKAAFPELQSKVLLTPVLDMTLGYDQALPVLEKMARKLGHSPKKIAMAAQFSLSQQKQLHERFLAEGQVFLEELAQHKTEMAIVLVGRPYNAMTKLGNMGIPRKLTSRGLRIIPQDFLPLDAEAAGNNMYWASGSTILKTANAVKAHSQLFGVFVTNFSCGPDSFLLGYFRDIMGKKPSLTLELDAHTADAGIDTRIEAFLDVAGHYRHLNSKSEDVSTSGYTPAKLVKERGRTFVATSNGRRLPLNHPDVHMLMCSMGELGAKFLGAAMRHVGVRTTVLPAPAEHELKLGRALVSCKECLPLVTTAGSLMRFVEEDWNKQDVLVNFLPETSGPCRFGQYNVMMQGLVEKLQLPDLAMISLTAENSYAGFGVKFAMRAWHAVVLSDVLDDMQSAILALATDPEAAMKTFSEQMDLLIFSIEHDNWAKLQKKIAEIASVLAAIPRKGELSDLPVVSLIGEIYVRRDGFSRMGLMERLSREGYLVRTAPVAEWIHYCDYIVQNRLVAKSNFGDRLRNKLTCMIKDPMERVIQDLLVPTGLYQIPSHHAKDLVDTASAYVSPRLTGETVLTVGAALDDGSDGADGVLSLGPFGCMPARISEAVVTRSQPTLPFLPIETDGNAFPQVIESRIEAFLLQVRRHREARTNRSQNEETA